MARYTKSDWLERGLEALVRSGVEVVTIDAMCQQLQVTKGSFYHHFRSQEDFQDALLLHWEEHYTSAFIEYSQQGTTPTEQLNRLQEIVVETFGTQENAIRAWAQTDARARRVVERVDGRRIAYLTMVHTALHGDAQRARTFALLLYATLIGASEIIPPATREELSAMFTAIGRMSAMKERES